MEVVAYCCNAGPDSKPFTEVHGGYSVSYVRQGSFGYQVLGKSYELVAGSVLVGQPGDEFICTHDHAVCGDECLAFHLTPGFVELIAGDAPGWRSGGLPPLPELVVLGELAQAAARQRSDVGLEEAGLWFVSRFAQVMSGRAPTPGGTSGRHRQRVVDAALWITAHSPEDLALDQAASQAGLSPFHFLRLFSKVLGVTPHQYLVRSRLRHAARLLADGDQSVTNVALDVGFADLSNFVRTFHRAAGVSPSGFRLLSRKGLRENRNIFQDRIAALMNDDHLIHSSSRKSSTCTNLSD